MFLLLHHCSKNCSPFESNLCTLVAAWWLLCLQGRKAVLLFFLSFFFFFLSFFPSFLPLPHGCNHSGCMCHPAAVMVLIVDRGQTLPPQHQIYCSTNGRAASTLISGLVKSCFAKECRPIFLEFLDTRTKVFPL